MELAELTFSKYIRENSIFKIFKMSEANLRKVTKKLVIVTKDEGLALKNHLNL